MWDDSCAVTRLVDDEHSYADNSVYECSKNKKGAVNATPGSRNDYGDAN